MNNKIEITIELKDHAKAAAASVQQSFTDMSSRLKAGFKEISGAAARELSFISAEANRLGKHPHSRGEDKPS